MSVALVGCVYPMVSAEHVARGLSAKVWVDHVVGRAGRGKGKYCMVYIYTLHTVTVFYILSVCVT